MYDFLRSVRDLQVVNLKFQTDVKNFKFWFLYKKYNGVKDSNVHLSRFNSVDSYQSSSYEELFYELKF